MRFIVFFGSIIIATSFSVNAQAVEELYGTWSLVSFTWQEVETGETSDLFGKAPHGFINYGRDGRMYAIIVSEKRPKPTDLAKMTDKEQIELFKTVIAYAGTFKVEGTRVIHNIDISWNENWSGTVQVRNFQIDGRELTISVDPQVGTEGKVITAVLKWEKIQ